jgi:hypothetical protein
VQDILQILAAGANPIEIHSFRLWTNQPTDAFIDLEWVRRSTNGTGGGTAITPRPRNRLNTRAAVMTVTPLVTTPGSLVADSQIDPIEWNPRYPLEVVYTPDERPYFAAADRFCLAMLTTGLGASRKLAGWVKLLEG